MPTSKHYPSSASTDASALEQLCSDVLHCVERRRGSSFSQTAVFAAATSAALAPVPDCDAVPVQYMGPSVILSRTMLAMVGSTNSIRLQQGVDINSDAVIDFTLSLRSHRNGAFVPNVFNVDASARILLTNTNAVFTLPLLPGAPPPNPPFTLTGNEPNAWALGYGAVIPGARPLTTVQALLRRERFQTGSGAFTMPRAGFGAWFNSMSSPSFTGYAGLGFHIGTELHFAWLRLSLQFDARGAPQRLELEDAYWQSAPDRRILAGQTEAGDANTHVPEPSTLGLVGLGLLALGARGIRRHREWRGAP